MMKKTRTQEGFSLLELLLSVGVFAGIMLAVFHLLQTYAERELARATDKYMTSVAQAMDQILDNVDNFNALYNLARSNNGYQLVADATMPNANNIAKLFSVTYTPQGGGPAATVWIQPSRLLNNQVRTLSPLRSDVRILLRVADDPAITTDYPALDVLIVTATPKPDAIVRLAANSSSYAGGVIRTYGSKATAEMSSSFGSWRILPSQGLQGTAWYQSELQNSLNSVTQGSYLVYYTYANSEQKSGDYLYRITDPDGTLRRNTMYASLNLGGNDIVGIDDINIGNDGSAIPYVSGETGVSTDCANSVLCVNGTAALKGSGTVTGTMVTNGSALVADSLSASRMRVQNGLSAADKQTYGAQNLFVVDGNGNDGGGSQDTVHVTGNATFTDGGTVLNGNLDTTTGTTVTMPEGGIHQTDSIVARRISSSDIDANNLVASHQLRSGIVEGGAVTVNGRSGVIDIRDSRDMQYGFGTGANTKTLSAARVNIQTLSVSSFGACTSGCGQ